MRSYLDHKAYIAYPLSSLATIPVHFYTGLLVHQGNALLFMTCLLSLRVVKQQQQQRRRQQQQQQK